MIDFDLFLDWAESRFGDVIVKGDEIRVNSIFEDDTKHHMWCNPSGGKHGIDHGVFHCWKSGAKGSLISLIMQVDNCTYEQALEILGGADTRLSVLEKRVQEMFEKRKIEEPPAITEGLQLPPFTYLFDDLLPSSYSRVQAEVYLFQRKLSTNGLMVCTAGEYRNRIIIPYYNETGKLIYFNGRYIGESDKVGKYKGPSKESGVGKAEVLYFQEWPKEGAIVYLTEGEFDSQSVKMCSYDTGAFGGKALSETQIEILRNKKYIPIICLDSDEAGKYGLRKMGEQLTSAGFDKFGFVRSPTQYKDWNAFLQALGTKLMRRYIETKTKFYGGSHGVMDGRWTSIALQSQDL
jgi:DNA primase